MCNSCAKGNRQFLTIVQCCSCALRDCSWRCLNGLYQLRKQKRRAAQRRSSWEKMCLSEEVPQWRSSSAKKNSSLIYPSIHPPILKFIRSFICWFSDSWVYWLTVVHWFISSLIHWFIASLLHLFTDSLLHWFVESLLHCFVASLILWFVDSLIHWLTDSLIHCFIDS